MELGIKSPQHSQSFKLYNVKMDSNFPLKSLRQNTKVSTYSYTCELRPGRRAAWQSKNHPRILRSCQSALGCSVGALMFVSSTLSKSLDWVRHVINISAGWYIGRHRGFAKFVLQSGRRERGRISGHARHDSRCADTSKHPSQQFIHAVASSNDGGWQEAMG